mmetsp:Transcript_71374/g.127303  ORF Transcript_71374/g.127303 Transcript_71374/m.127303 type:complete len:413 (+) Transcript_71374:68-1306(+)
MAATYVVAGQVLLVASMSALLPALKGGSLTRPLPDPQACEEAMHAGATCTPCVSKFKQCRGHFVYEPFTVVLFEAVVTVVVGVILTIVLTPRGDAWRFLLDWGSLRRVLPIGATYALGDLMDLAAARNISATTLLVASQMRLPLCALLRSALLGRAQSFTQWVVLLGISLLCIGQVLSDFQESSDGKGVGIVASAASAAGVAVGAAGGETAGGLMAALTAWATSAAGLVSPDVLGVLPLLAGKCLISCGGAVHAEFFLQHREVKQMPLWATQVHFKIATVLGTLAVGFYQGRRGGRIMASHWRSDLFTLLPEGTHANDPRTPFFGGWDRGTWALLLCLVVNNFIIGHQLRRLTAVSKYVAYALGMVLSYSSQLWTGDRPFNAVQACCCGGIGILALGYICLPGPSAEQKKQD